MTSHLGNLAVTKENALSFPAVEAIYGHLTIGAGAELRAPRLTMVRGWVTVLRGASLTAPQLGLIDGWAKVDGHLSALHLTEVRQDLSMGESSVIDLPALTTVGSISMARGAAKNLVSLTEVRESVTLMAMARLQADRLEKIGRSITLRENARLDAPELSYIGGYADIDETAVIVAPNYGRK